MIDREAVNTPAACQGPGTLPAPNAADPHFVALRACDAGDFQHQLGTVPVIDAED